jgi:hypothetical protein
VAPSPKLERNDSLDEANHAAEGVDLTRVESASRETRTDANQPPYDTPDALLHFAELIRFIEKYLDNQLRLYGRLRSGIEPKVAFENLWMLFKSEDKVYSPSRKGGQTVFPYYSLTSNETVNFKTARRDVSQVHMVLATAGGRALFDKLTPRKPNDANIILINQTKDGRMEQQAPRSAETAKDRYSPLYIYVCYLDWVDSRIGPRTTAYSIRPYDGEVEISSLDLYPINYRRKQTSIGERQDLVKRGLTFIDYTAATHLQYHGLTLGNNREEVGNAHSHSLCIPNSCLRSMARLSSTWSKRSKKKVTVKNTSVRHPTTDTSGRKLSPCQSENYRCGRARMQSVTSCHITSTLAPPTVRPRAM